MIYSAHQPNYLPYLGLFYKIYKSDVFIFLDDVQFTKSSGPAHERNVISCGNRKIYLKVPIKYNFKDKIKEVKINYDIEWQKQHMACIAQCYSDAPYYAAVMRDIEPVLMTSFDNLAELNMALITLICKKAGMHASFIKSSDMNIQSTKTERLIELGKKVGGTEYYSGTGAKVYMDVDLMESCGIKLTYSDYQTAYYKKQDVPCNKNMSVLDYIFYYGYDFSALGW